MASRRQKKIPFVRFATETLHLVLSDPWRVLLLVAIDGVAPARLDDDDREIARQLFGDVDEVPDDARRMLVWRLGRGSGKSTIAVALALWCLWTVERTWGPGQVPAAVVVAPSKAVAKLDVGVARDLVRGSDLERYVVKKSDSEEGFRLRRPDDALVEFKCVAASRGGRELRGYDIVTLILDESEFMGSNADVAAADGYAVSDRDQVRAAAPRVLGFTVLISTPWPTENLTSETFDRNHGNPQDALACVGASTTMRPDDKRLAKDVARMLATDEETAQREFFCDPGVRGGRQIFVEGLAEAIDRDRPLVIRAQPGATIGCGGDLGLERDSSAIAFASLLAGNYEVLEFDEIRPAKGAPLSPGYVVGQRFAPLMLKHGTKSIMLDAHYRQSAIEHLTAQKLAFEDAPTGQQGKYDVYMFFRGLLRGGAIKLPNAPRLLAQMRSVVAVPMQGNKTRITSPRRAGQGHGDVVSAVVLSVWAARGALGSAPRPYSHLIRHVPRGNRDDEPIGEPRGNFGGGNPNSNAHLYIAPPPTAAMLAASLAMQGHQDSRVGLHNAQARASVAQVITTTLGQPGAPSGVPAFTGATVTPGNYTGGGNIPGKK